MQTNIRNVAIIAHVDHGKTTLVDAFLRQSDSFHFKEGQTDLIMDSNQLERERGITIFSKNAAVKYKDYKINIIDTPGHADFGGEVERIMSMADGVLLLVDAKEGPMPQTKFVLKKALEKGHKVILVINKIDAPGARPDWVLNETFDLFVDLGATDEQADFPVLYARALVGKAGPEAELDKMTNISPIFDAIVQHIPGPKITDGPMQMLVVNFIHDSYKGQIAIGPLVSGAITKGQEVARIGYDGSVVKAKIAAVMVFDGIQMAEVDNATAGDIVAVAGLETVKIGETIADADNPKQLPVIKIDEPTVKMSFAVNTSPFAGREGEFSTSRHLKARLMREELADIALRVEASKTSDSDFVIFGRGELHIAILIEKMRNEGYEFQVGKPQVIYKEIDGREHEPFEDVYIECLEQYSGTVINKLGQRRAELINMSVEDNLTKLHFLAATRALIGYRSEFLTDTRGEGIISTLFHGYLPSLGPLEDKEHGSLVAHEEGVSTHYGLVPAQARGTLFVGPGVNVYEGMVVGQNSRAEDMDINICKEKKLTNMRAAGSDNTEVLHVAKTLSLEEAIEYLSNDELLEVTPQNLRIRKTHLSKTDRKRASRK